MITCKEKVSEATEEGERVKLRLCYARVEVDKRYKVTLRWGSGLLSCQYSGTTFCSLMSLLVQTLTMLDCSCVRLVSSVEQASEHKTKGLGFKSHVRLSLYLEHILHMKIYDIFIYVTYRSHHAPP